MSYKIGEIPQLNSHLEEIADFWEIQAIRRCGTWVGAATIQSIIARSSDELSHEGIESDDDRISEKLESVFFELTRRNTATRNNYPFEASENAIRIPSKFDYAAVIYLFLILATRLNMKAHKIQGGIDGTELFEELCAQVLRSFLGQNAKSWVFGTANNEDVFRNKVEELIRRIGDGQGFMERSRHGFKNDDGVDIVGWIDFADMRRGKLISFGQCKTGTSWRNGIVYSKLTGFCEKWMQSKPLPTFFPFPALFLADTLFSNEDPFEHHQNTLTFNRFRIMEYIPEVLDDDLFDRISSWVQESANLATDGKPLIIRQLPS